MSRFKNFMITTLIGGIAVVLPAALSAFLLKWLFKVVISIIRPLTIFVFAKSDIEVIFADTIVIAIILLACFLVGMIVKTRLGVFIQESIDDYILKYIPGYSIIKETVLQFLGRKKFPFSPVVLVRAFENDTLMTGFITDEHPNDQCTVFVPTGPNVTTGFVFHLSRNNVYPLKVSADQAIRTVISCGVGSDKLINEYSQQAGQTQQIAE